MPKIEAYKGAGTIIPVDEAYVGTAYRCPWTGDIFGNKDTYVKHLKRYRKSRIHEQIRLNNISNTINELANQPDFDEVINWISHNPSFMFTMAQQNTWGNRSKDLATAENFWFEITYLKLNWDNRVSNSHSCPRGGVQNFTGRYTFKDGTPKPTGYPGWQGRIEYKTSHDFGTFSHMTSAIGIHTGTGGGNSKVYGFDVKFFASDWPTIAKSVEEKQLAHNSEAVMARLADKYHPPFNWEYNYGEPNYFRR